MQWCDIYKSKIYSETLKQTPKLWDKKFWVFLNISFKYLIYESSFPGRKGNEEINSNNDQSQPGISFISVLKSEECRIFISMQESIQSKTNNLYFWN